MKQTSGKYFWPIIISLLFILIYTCNSGESESDTPRTSIDKYEAKYVAEEQIKLNLKSPSTAEFSTWGYTVITPIPFGYEVSGYVDSQNGFGAMIRSNYSVEIYFDKSSGNINYRNLKVE